MNVVSISIVILLMGYIGYLSIRYRRWNLLIVILFTMLSICYIKASNFVFQKVLQPHQRTRIEVLLGMRYDPSGAEYNINQARIAIGSGRFFGKGYLQGTQTKLRYVPEQDTDFIFCTIGEEWGFVGSSLVLLIYLGFILRLLVIAERQRNQFSQIYGYSVACIFLFHLVINIGMVLGLLPVIGIPLPFFSYGGSSLLGFTILLFILLKLDAVRLNQLH
ncbi:MAG: rod shape-determining protein RodA, partial [Prevotellaceae bacterium]|nr:rod shape-determining protein RodA [Candidatus Faecinaster equi]